MVSVGVSAGKCWGAGSGLVPKLGCRFRLGCRVRLGYRVQGQVRVQGRVRTCCDSGNYNRG